MRALVRHAPALLVSCLTACGAADTGAVAALPGTWSPAADAAVPVAPDGAQGSAFAAGQGGAGGADACGATVADLAPLFASAAPVVPIRFTRDDGVLVTRGAGRVRQRHELEGTFGPFGPHYFEHRTFGFIVEDYTGLGESLVRVTYLPVARPLDSTNFRAFKDYGNGNVFNANTGMTSDVPLPSLAHGGADPAASYAQSIASYARAQAHEVERNAREGRPLQRGDLLEFEFGVFIDPSALRQGSRGTYYSDTFRYRVGEGGLTADNQDPGGRMGPTAEAALGADTTTVWMYAEPETSFSQMATNIQHEHVQGFVEGRRLFHTDFASGAHSEPGNPAFSEQASKAGPVLQTASCETCHPRDGGGRPLAGALDAASSTVLKLYGGGALGAQLQPSEGLFSRAGDDTHEVTLGDGARVTLSRPRYTLDARGVEVVQRSPRIARRLIGLGLLEAIDEADVVAGADPDDCDADGVSGRVQRGIDPADGGRKLGRFGWRAEKVSLAHQVSEALSLDMGVDTSRFPGASDATELSDADLERMVTYMRLVGVPGQRDHDDPEVLRGEGLFAAVGCGSCHTSGFTTGDRHPFVELRGQRVRPYTDLLLHDLGADLCDDGGRCGDGQGDEAATGSEWRTAPLWGIGLAERVQGYTALLHDGRAQSVTEAVLWHGGEASGVRARFMGLSAEERGALVRFVESL